MNFSRFLGLLVLVRGKNYSLILLYVLVIGSTVMESIGIALFYPLAEMFQDANQVSSYRYKLAAWVSAVGSLNQEQFLSYSLGPRILRAETASISSCTIIQHILGDI